MLNGYSYSGTSTVCHVYFSQDLIDVIALLYKLLELLDTFLLPLRHFSMVV